ncbi:phosphoesterase-like protein [Candidatus Symbiobacter mobilis CR]|uniref:Phosphoesterase-like protein n=2 Tax=Candidatus Symbiobacter TaxID=1436289 RepID=U5NAF7_9BURK|nr:PHP domain-containing protein [Candidatus Symbiobacter mobilis]AGX87243.1 phosphoesterase-like protein [Candidatus Symbiobacter mobilis CR]
MDGKESAKVSATATGAIRADLHCHSMFSDGTLTPEALAERAAANGVTLWALTDHDEIRGQPRARAAALAHGVGYVSGVEISVTHAGRTIHIVGLGFDDGDTVLERRLQRLRQGRVDRARAIAEELGRVGIAGAWEGAMRYVRNPELMSRTHFARYLVALGVCSTPAGVFKKYLVRGKPGYVPHEWALMADAIGWIRGAGGMAVLAHPGRYRMGRAAGLELLAAFQERGGEGIEVATSNHNDEECAYWAGLAAQHGLWASCGSDFHDPAESRMDVGKAPDLPHGVKPVWEGLRGSAV